KMAAETGHRNGSFFTRSETRRLSHTPRVARNRGDFEGPPANNGGDRTGWLGMSDSNSEMSSGSIHLRRRTDFQKSNRILATETIRVWAAAFQIRSSCRGPGSRQGSE